MNYSQFWFIDTEILLQFDLSKEYHILVIDCFEGLSSVFFADNFLEHPTSTLTCIDPHNDYFDSNLSLCKNRDKITIVDEIPLKTFNLIYMDKFANVPLEKDGTLWIEENINTENYEIIHAGYPLVVKLKP